MGDYLGPHLSCCSYHSFIFCLYFAVIHFSQIRCVGPFPGIVTFSTYSVFFLRKKNCCCRWGGQSGSLRGSSCCVAVSAPALWPFPPGRARALWLDYPLPLCTLAGAPWPDSVPSVSWIPLCLHGSSRTVLRVGGGGGTPRV